MPEIHHMDCTCKAPPQDIELTQASWRTHGAKPVRKQKTLGPWVEGVRELTLTGLTEWWREVLGKAGLVSVWRHLPANL